MRYSSTQTSAKVIICGRGPHTATPGDGGQPERRGGGDHVGRLHGGPLEDEPEAGPGDQPERDADGQLTADPAEPVHEQLGEVLVVGPEVGGHGVREEVVGGQRVVVEDPARGGDVPPVVGVADPAHDQRQHRDHHREDHERPHRPAHLESPRAPAEAGPRSRRSRRRALPGLLIGVESREDTVTSAGARRAHFVDCGDVAVPASLARCGLRLRPRRAAAGRRRLGEAQHQRVAVAAGAAAWRRRSSAAAAGLNRYPSPTAEPLRSALADAPRRRSRPGGGRQRRRRAHQRLHPRLLRAGRRRWWSPTRRTRCCRSPRASTAWTRSPWRSATTARSAQEFASLRGAAALPRQPQHAHRHLDRARGAGGGAGRRRRRGGHRRGVLRLRAALLRPAARRPPQLAGAAHLLQVARAGRPARGLRGGRGRARRRPRRRRRVLPGRPLRGGGRARGPGGRRPPSAPRRARWSPSGAGSARRSAERGWSLTPSHANFVCGVPPGGSAAEVTAALRDRGVLVRCLTSGGRRPGAHHRGHARGERRAPRRAGVRAADRPVRTLSRMTGPGAAARPGGFGDWLPGAAAERRALTGALLGTFEAAGFALIDTPTVEYADTIERGPGPRRRRRALPLHGRRRQPCWRWWASGPSAWPGRWRPSCAGGPFPLRLCYAGPVVRNRTLLGGRRREADAGGLRAGGRPRPRRRRGVRGPGHRRGRRGRGARHPGRHRPRRVPPRAARRRRGRRRQPRGDRGRAGRPRPRGRGAGARRRRRWAPPSTPCCCASRRCAAVPSCSTRPGAGLEAERPTARARRAGPALGAARAARPARTACTSTSARCATGTTTPVRPSSCSAATSASRWARAAATTRCSSGSG